MNTNEKTIPLARRTIGWYWRNDPTVRAERLRRGLPIPDGVAAEDFGAWCSDEDQEDG